MIKCLESHSLAVSMIIMIAGLFFLVTPERQEPTPKWADYYIDELIQKGSNVLPIDVLSHPINTLDQCLDRSGLMSGHIVCLKSR